MGTIGILGSGNVGSALADALRPAGHRVLVGSRDPGRAAGLVGLAEAASAGVVVNALPGAVALETLRGLRSELSGGVLVDVANAVEGGDDGFASRLLYPQSSLAEQLQRALPETNVVKALNTVGPAALMADPTSLSAPLSTFLCGDDAEAKRVTAGLLRDLGWPEGWVVDLGGVAAAWWPEQFVLMVRPLVAAFGPVPFGLAVVR